MITRDEATANPGMVSVSKASGEYLQFTIAAAGPLPIFVFSSSARPEPLYEAPDFMGHPRKTYKWEHLKNPSDARAIERLEVSLLCFTNQKYTYKVERCQADGTVMATVLEVSWKGDPTDQVAEGFFLIVT